MIRTHEWVYAQRAGMDLTAVAYLPDNPSSSTLLLDIHGGAWSSGDKHAGRHYCDAIAASGTPVVAIDFRQARIFSIQLPLRTSSWQSHTCARSHRLPLVFSVYPGVPAEGIGAQWPSIQHHRNRPSILSLHSGLYLTLARYQYLVSRLHEDPSTFKRFTPDRLKAGHEGYFGEPAQMAAAAIQNQLTAGQYRDLPPLLLVQPELDQNVPIMMSQTLQGAWEIAGGDVDYRLYPDVGHGFAQADGPQTQTMYCRHDQFYSAPHR